MWIYRASTLHFSLFLMLNNPCISAEYLCGGTTLGCVCAGRMSRPADYKWPRVFQGAKVQGRNISINIQERLVEQSEHQRDDTCMVLGTRIRGSSCSHYENCHYGVISQDLPIGTCRVDSQACYNISNYRLGIRSRKLI